MDGRPILVDSDSTRLLEKVDLSRNNLYESELQELCFSYPEILPMKDIEPIYGEAVPICKELKVESGYCDVLYVNSNGFITIVETKLWKNPEARRKVVSQILDYAKDISNMNYDEFELRCLKARKGPEKSLYEILSNYGHEVEEQYFIDQVVKNLSRGRFLLLIIGDGIRENTQEIAKFMNRTANMSFTMALVATQIYELEESKKIVIPQVIAKTVEIEREVFVLKNQIVDAKPSIQKSSKSISASESEFYERLSNNIGSTETNKLREFIELLNNELDMFVSVGRGKTLSLNLKDSEGRYNFASFQETGEVMFYGIVVKMNEVGYGKIAEDYLNTLANIMNAKYDKSLKMWHWCVKKEGKYLHISEYLKRSNDWKILLESILMRIDDAQVDM